MILLKEGRTNWKYILIVAILAIIVGGGILGYRYWWMPKEETKMPEVKAPEEMLPIVRYIDVVLEEGADRSPYPPTQRLIGIKNEGTKVVILENVNDVLPVSWYGQTKGRNKEEDDLYVIPFIYSFAPGEQKVYIKRVEDGTEIYDYVYEYDLLSGKIQQLNLPGKYIFSYNHYHKLSPDGIKVVVYGFDGVGVFNLVKNEEVIFIKEEAIDGVLGHEAVVSPPENESLNLLQWKSSTVVEYPIYQETEEKYVYQLKMIETIDLTEIKDETADWKTYRNEEYGFEIRYPEDWSLSEFGFYTYFTPKKPELEKVGARFDILRRELRSKDEIKCKNEETFLNTMEIQGLITNKCAFQDFGDVAQNDWRVSIIKDSTYLSFICKKYQMIEEKCEQILSTIRFLE